MKERYKTIDAAFVVVHLEDKVLLHRRSGTGFRDGEYDTPSGHVEPGETPQEAGLRELIEETGLVANLDDLELFHVVTNEADTPGEPYTYFIFRIGLLSCEGKFEIKEPNKCDDMKLFPIHNLPKTTPYVRRALADLFTTTVTFSKFVT